MLFPQRSRRPPPPAAPAAAAGAGAAALPRARRGGTPERRGALLLRAALLAAALLAAAGAGARVASSVLRGGSALGPGTQVRRAASGAPGASSVPGGAAAGAGCRWEGRSGPNDGTHAEMELDFAGVRSFAPAAQERLRQVRHLTVDSYEKYLTSPPGREHYVLLHYLVDRYGAAKGATASGGSSEGDDECRHVVDVGTRYAASAAALGSPARRPTRVWTFDLPASREREEAYRGATEEEWQSAARAAGVDVTFHNLNLLAVPDEEFRRYMATWLILLDTAHLPRTVPFEREFFQRLQAIGYRGLLLLDDIHLNDEMKEWWGELQAGAEGPPGADGGPPYRAYDVTAVGHTSGTGLVDFSSRLTVKAS